jgi:hypothetical protein
MTVTDEDIDLGETQQPGTFSPPYVSWTTFLNTIERMTKEGGIPAQIDRSYLSNLPGSSQTPLMAAMKSLGLINEEAKPTADLETLVDEPEGRKDLMETIIKIHYPGPLKLGPFATQMQLEDEFRKYGVSGSTLRKAVGFFLSAAKYADIPLSPHFKLPRAQPGETRPRKARPPAGNGGNEEKPLTPPDTAMAKAHPLVRGLFEELPRPGDEFTAQQQADWLELAKVAFRVIYKTPVKAQGSSSDEGGGSD